MGRNDNPMTLTEYQKSAQTTAHVYREAVAKQIGKEFAFLYSSLGLANEAGEVAGKVKKILRDKGGIVDDETRSMIAKELGDVLWYAACVAEDFGLSLEDVAAQNLEKLRSRNVRGTISGDGDER